MHSFKDKFTGAWMLTGDRRVTYYRTLAVDSFVALPCGVLAYLLVVFGYGWTSVPPLLTVFVVSIYRISRKETLWQLKRRELQSGKHDLNEMRQEIEKLLSES